MCVCVFVCRHFFTGLTFRSDASERSDVRLVHFKWRQPLVTYKERSNTYLSESVSLYEYLKRTNRSEVSLSLCTHRGETTVHPLLIRRTGQTPTNR